MNPPQRILVVRNDRLGEFLLTLPACSALKKKFPHAELIIVVNPALRELAQNLDFVDKVIVWENKKHKFSEIFKFAQELRNLKLDLCVIFNPTREFHLISFLAAISKRIGYNRKLGFLLTRKIKDLKFLGEKHEVEYNFDLVRLIGIEPKEREFILQLHSEKNLLSDSGFIAIHPWSSNQEKEWRIDNFKEIVRRLIDKEKQKVLLIGGKEESTRVDSFWDKPGIVNLTGKTDLLELAEVLKKCKFLITVDSGPMHLAGVLGVPVLAIFRKSPPALAAWRWGPLGDNHIIIESDCVRCISVEEVWDGVKKFLG